MSPQTSSKLFFMQDVQDRIKKQVLCQLFSHHYHKLFLNLTKMFLMPRRLEVIINNDKVLCQLFKNHNHNLYLNLNKKL